MWTPGRRSSSTGGASPFCWTRTAKKKKKNGGLDTFSYTSDDEHFIFSGSIENPSPLVRRSFMPTPSPEPKNPFLSSLRSLFRRPSRSPTPRRRRRRRLSATIYGRRRGRANLLLQENPSSEPLLLLELAIATGKLVRQMASGPVRILLECQEQQKTIKEKKKKKMGLWEEPIWTMFCNGARSGYAVAHHCGELELELLRKLETVSVGAGVLQENFGEEDEMMYMRAKFERVVENSDSETLYMVNPDGSGRNGPELSFFLLRL